MPLQQNELVTFLLLVGVMFFFVGTFSRSRLFPGWNYFFISFSFLLTGWFFTNVEGIWGGVAYGEELAIFCNMLEHVSYLAGSIMFMAWSFHVSIRPRGRP